MNTELGEKTYWEESQKEMDKNSTSASTSKAPKNEVIPMWKLNTFLQKHVITKVIKM